MTTEVNLASGTQRKLTLVEAARLLLGLPPKSRDKRGASELKAVTQRLRDEAEKGRLTLVVKDGKHAVELVELYRWGQLYGSAEMLQQLGIDRVPIIATGAVTMPTAFVHGTGHAIPMDVPTLQAELIRSIQEHSNLTSELNHKAAEVIELTPDAEAFRRNREKNRSNGRQPKQPRNKKI